MQLSADRVQVGATDFRVPRFGLGTAHLGGMFRRVDEAEARATLEAAWDSGIRFYDTAPWYGRGLSEHRLGSFLIDKPRAEFVVTTKVGRVLHRPKGLESFDRAPWGGGLNFEVEFNYSHDGVMRAYEQCLQRLALDTVDALLIHDLDAEGHGAEFPRHARDLVDSGHKALVELKRAGDIKAIGMGINLATSLENVATLVDLDFVLVAMPYTLIDQAVLHTGLATCLRRKVSVIVGAPFASGILVTGAGPDAKYFYRPAPDEVQAKVKQIEAVCQRHGVALPSAALQFPLAHPAVVAIIPGAARPGEVTANVSSFLAPIATGFWTELRQRGLIDPEAPTPG